MTLGAALSAQSRDPASLSLQPLWSLPLGGAISAPVAFVGARAYVPLDARRLDAFDLLGGIRLWSADIGAITRPAVGEGLVFVETSGAIVALREADGATAWRVSLAEMLGSALVWDNGWLITQSRSGLITAYRALDGHLIWQREAGAAPSAPAALAADRVYVSLADGRVLALQVESGDPLWERTLGGPLSEILALETRLYVGAGSLDRYFYAIDTRSGRVEWRWRIGGALVGRPVLDDRHVYFVAFDNVLRALDRGHGALRWHAALPLRPTGAPILAGDIVLVTGVVPTLPTFLRRSGEPAGTATLPGDIAAGPHIVEHPWAPFVFAITRDIARGDALRALGRRVEPDVVQVAPLPGAVRPQPRPAPLHSAPASGTPPRDPPRGRAGPGGAVTGSR